MKLNNIAFALVWTFISIFLGKYIVDIINILERLTDYLILALKYIILLPSKPGELIGVSLIFSLIIGLVVAFFTTPLVKKLYELIIQILKKIPI